MRPRTRRNSGQIMVVALLGSALLAGLVFYVANTGDQVNRRVAMQNAADSAAISGSSWMARGINVVAMNNMGQARMLTLVPVLDAFPLSVKMSFEEVDAWTGCLENQLTRGVPDDKLRQGLQSLRDRMARQRDVLRPVNDLLNPGGEIGQPVTPLTTWMIRGHAGPPPHGTLWQAAQSLDEFSQATATSAGVLAQLNAGRWGKADGAEVVFVVPIDPVMPAKRTAYGDFEPVIKTGRAPDYVEHKRKGPCDRLYLWRDYRYQQLTEPDHMVPGTPGHGPIRAGSDRPGGPSGGRINGRGAMGTTTDPNDHWVNRTVGTVLLGYTIYGPYEWMMRRVHGYAYGWREDRGYHPGELSDTYFHTYHRQIADIKLGYMFGSSTPQYVHYPQYRLGVPPSQLDLTNYAQAKNLMTTSPQTNVAKTMFYKFEVRSKYPKGDPSYLSAGSFKTNADLPIAMWLDGWQDPESPDDKKNWHMPRIADYVWEDQWNYETTEDWDINIRREPDPGNPAQDKWQKVYMVSQYVFGGIDVGGLVEVTNPANFSDRNELPSPVVMDLSYGDYDMSQPDHDLGVRRDVYTYLGVAKTKNDPMIWAPRFGSGNPYHGVTAVGQAEIFNTRSWDLWTQDWKTQLVPVSYWSEWVAKLQAGIGEASGANGLDAAVLQEIQTYFSRFDEEMVNEMMNH